MADTSSATAPKRAYRKLTPQQRKFVDLVSLGKTKPIDAVRQIRPKLGRPDDLAWRWKNHPDVKAAIAEREEEAIEQAGVTDVNILLGLAKIATLSPKDFVHPDGRPKQVHELDDDVAQCIQSIEIEEIAGVGLVRTKFKAPSKIEARKLLGQHKKLFTEKHEHAGPGGKPLQPPVIGITFPDGGPGTPATGSGSNTDDGVVETS